MTQIPLNQGAVKQSELFTDDAIPLFGTSIGEDGLTVLQQVSNVASDIARRKGQLLTSRDNIAVTAGSVTWDGTTLTFNGATNIILKLLQNEALQSLSAYPLDLMMTYGASNGETSFNSITIPNGYIVYIELERSVIPSSPTTTTNGVTSVQVPLHNAAGGGSTFTGLTVRVAPTLPVLASTETGVNGTLCIPIAVAIDTNLYWQPNGTFWAANTTNPVGSLFAPGGGIINLVPPASVTYVPATPAYVFQSNVNTSADLDAGPITIRNNTAGSPGVTLNPPPGSFGNYSLFMPTTPANTSFLTISPSGVIAPGPATSYGITNTNIAFGTISQGNMGILIPQYSGLTQVSITATGTTGFTTWTAQVGIHSFSGGTMYVGLFGGFFTLNQVSGGGNCRVGVLTQIINNNNGNVVTQGYHVACMNSSFPQYTVPCTIFGMDGSVADGSNVSYRVQSEFYLFAESGGATVTFTGAGYMTAFEI